MAAARVTSGPMPSPGSSDNRLLHRLPRFPRILCASGASRRTTTQRLDAADCDYATVVVCFSAHELAPRRITSCAIATRSRCANFFRFVRQRRHAASSTPPVPQALGIVAQFFQLDFNALRPECLPSTSARRHADRLRRNNFVRQRILDDAVLVNARFVGKRVRARPPLYSAQLAPR